MPNKIELELLGLLQEESAEIIQILSKVRRFGFDSYNPYDPSGKDNRTLSTDEIGDFYAIMALLYSMGTFDPIKVADRMSWKLAKLKEHWGYALAKPDNEVLASEGDVLLHRLVQYAEQAEDGYKVPGEAAGRHLVNAIRSLRNPEPKPFKEALSDLAALGAFDDLDGC
jgi:hypothetical protein